MLACAHGKCAEREHQLLSSRRQCPQKDAQLGNKDLREAAGTGTAQCSAPALTQLASASPRHWPLGSFLSRMFALTPT